MSDRTKIKITVTGNEEDLYDLSDDISYKLFKSTYMIGINDFDIDEQDNNDGTLIVTCHTRWLPPIETFESLKVKYSRLQFTFQWREEGDRYRKLYTYGINNEDE
jgi:hypothetical protein